MCLRAAIASPLRSKRAMISPVSRRAKASGLMRTRVRSKPGLPECRLAVLAGGRANGFAGRGAPLGGGRATAVGSRGGLGPGPGRGGSGRASAGAPLRARDLGLAERADLPARIERLAAAAARLLESPQAARAAQEVLLDVEVAVRADLALELSQARLGGLDLELALVRVLQVLGRAHDHVDGRPDEREDQRGHRRG